MYVNGLPLDISEEEFYQLMSKYGIIKEGEDGTYISMGTLVRHNIGYVTEFSIYNYVQWNVA